MLKWIRVENRKKSQKFQCPQCNAICYCRANGNVQETHCDYNYCPYCGTAVQSDKEDT